MSICLVVEKWCMEECKKVYCEMKFKGRRGRNLKVAATESTKGKMIDNWCQYINDYTGLF